VGSIFIARLTYTVPIAQIDALLDAHLAWMKGNYEAGHFLAWGPCEPRNSGMIFMRAGSRAEAEAIAATDPFIVEKVATNEIIEWIPRFAGPGLEAFHG